MYPFFERGIKLPFFCNKTEYYHYESFIDRMSDPSTYHHFW